MGRENHGHGGGGAEFKLGGGVRGLSRHRRSVGTRREARGDAVRDNRGRSAGRFEHGGHVSAAAAARSQPRALFLLAPAFYMAGFESYTPQEVTCPVAIVHGWRDDIVPVENSVRWAGEHRAALHVLDSDHRLEDKIDLIEWLLRRFLEGLA